MDNPNVYTLAALQIDVAKDAILTPITALDGATGVSLEARFAYGSGGSTCSAIVLTSFDNGVTWRQIARFDFATVSATKIANLSMGPKAATVYADLASEGVNDGLLGDMLAARVISTGTYGNSTTLSLRASVR